MKRVRIGNDISIKWDVKKGKSDADLVNKEIHLYMTHPRGREEITDFESSEGNITFTLKGENMSVLGPYTFTIDIYVIDGERRKRYMIQDKCHVFELVGRSCAENWENDETINI